MPSPKKPTTPAEYFAALGEPRRTELKALDAAIRRAAPKLKPYLASASMLGYGPYRYRYASGREGESPIVALSSRAQGISLYICGHRNEVSIVERDAAKLGRVDAGKSCIRFKRLEDLNLPAAVALVREASALIDNGSTDFAL